MRKATVFVDETLIEEALKAENLRTKREVIELGLKELVRKKNRELLRQELGTVDIDRSLDELKRRRAGK